MANEQLIAYLKQYSQRGYSYSVLEKALSQQGYKKSDIRAAWIQINPAAASESPIQKEKPSISEGISSQKIMDLTGFFQNPIVIGLVVLVVVLGVAGILMLMQKSNLQAEVDTLETTISLRDSSISDLRNEVRDLNSNIESLNNDIISKDQEISQLNFQVTELNTQIQELNESLFPSEIVEEFVEAITDEFGNFSEINESANITEGI